MSNKSLEEIRERMEARKEYCDSDNFQGDGYMDLTLGDETYFVNHISKKEFLKFKDYTRAKRSFWKFW